MFSMTVCSRWAMNSRAFSEQKLRLKPIRQFLRAHVTVRFEDEDRRQHCNWVEQAGFLHLSSGTSFEDYFLRALCWRISWKLGLLRGGVPFAGRVIGEPIRIEARTEFRWLRAQELSTRKACE